MREIDDPTITIEGFNVTINCQVYGARPAANISLYFNDEEQFGFGENVVVYNESSDTYTTSAVYHRVIDRQDNEKKATCVVHHLALDNIVNKTWAFVVYCKLQNYPIYFSNAIQKKGRAGSRQ